MSFTLEDSSARLTRRLEMLTAEARVADCHMAALMAVLRCARPWAHGDGELARAIAAADSMDYSDASETAVADVTLNGDSVPCSRWSVTGGWLDVPVKPVRFVGGRVLTERLFGVVVEHLHDEDA